MLPVNEFPGVKILGITIGIIYAYLLHLLCLVMSGKGEGYFLDDRFYETK